MACDAIMVSCIQPAQAVFFMIDSATTRYVPLLLATLLHPATATPANVPRRTRINVCFRICEAGRYYVFSSFTIDMGELKPHSWDRDFNVTNFWQRLCSPKCWRDSVHIRYVPEHAETKEAISHDVK